MAQKIYVVEGRQFRNEVDYNRALHDQQLMERLRIQAQNADAAGLRQLLDGVKVGKYRFLTILEQDFTEELEELLQKKEKDGTLRKQSKSVKSANSIKTAKSARTAKDTKTKKSVKAAKGTEDTERVLDGIVKQEMLKQEKRRKLLVAFCSLTAVVCLGYCALYSWYNYKTADSYDKLNSLKEQNLLTGEDSEPVIHYTEDGSKEVPPVLDEYKNLLIKNKKLIGWVKIDDTNIDYPVMQTSDNEYYLDHNLNQEYDKNGSIFLDKDCDVLKPSTNFILYGHHMKSGQMFGNLHLYSEQKYCEEHPYIQFDTIYEKGIYQVMYVFRSKVYSEEEIVFKYYQFIDAQSEQEFDSYMQEMAALSLYDTGVTAQYGDQLLTLSTCDYQEKDGRFVVVARKVAKE